MAVLYCKVHYVNDMQVITIVLCTCSIIIKHVFTARLLIMCIPGGGGGGMGGHSHNTNYCLDLPTHTVQVTIGPPHVSVEYMH